MEVTFMFFTLNNLPVPGSDRTSNKLARLDKNENPFAIPAGLMEEIREGLSSIEMNRYPDPSYKHLRTRLAEIYNVPEKLLIVGNGGDEILWLLYTAFVNDNKPILTLDPTFSEYYHLASIFGAKQELVGLVKNSDFFSFDQDRFLKMLKEDKYSLVLIDTPNNPTGMPVDSSFLEKVLEVASCPVVIDEAYAEFAGKSFLDSLSPKELPENLIVLKTLSKAWGLAGLRLGFAICAKPISIKLSQIKSPFNVNVFTEMAVCKVLEYEEWMKNRVESIKYIRDSFINKTNQLKGWKAYPSKANFVLVEHSFSEKKILEEMSQNNIKVKKVKLGSYPDKNFIRVSIGTEREMDKLLKVFAANDRII
jgi:histidinol-phosphate aminotransferase